MATSSRTRPGSEGRPPWPTPEELAAALVSHGLPGTLSVELAPSGRLHPGIVRTLLYATAVADDLGAEGREGRVVVRVNDLAAVRVPREERLTKGAPLLRSVDGLVERFLDDLDRCPRRFPVRVDDVVLSSRLYGDDDFREAVREALEHAPAVAGALGGAGRRLFHPLCAGCGHLYCAEPLGEGWRGAGDYRCARCGHTGSFAAWESPGLVAFKLETVLLRAHLGVGADVHGQDHIEAYEAACRVSEALSARPPLAGRVNLTFNEAGEKVSKSRGNFTPVMDLDDTAAGALLALVRSVPWQRPVHLPPSV